MIKKICLCLSLVMIWELLAISSFAAIDKKDFDSIEKLEEYI